VQTSSFVPMVILAKYLNNHKTDLTSAPMFMFTQLTKTTSCIEYFYTADTESRSKQAPLFLIFTS